MQEVTLTGDYVRSIGEGVIGADIRSIAASTQLIAVSLYKFEDSGGLCVHLFDFATGALVRSFGRPGKASGQPNKCEGVRFTPDNQHIVATEWMSSRVSMFTVDGAFVRCFRNGALKRPLDVDFTSSGEIIVADEDASRLFIFSPGGSTLLRSIPLKGRPNAIAVQAGRLFVLTDDGVLVYT